MGPNSDFGSGGPVSLALGVLFASVGATFVDFTILIGVFLLLVAVEALNTAIECIVDHVTGDRAEFARNANDLGSLAVVCVLLGWGATCRDGCGEARIWTLSRKG